MKDNNVMILGNDNYYSLDCHKTQRNNNVLVVGASGAGKTRSIVSPNIMMATGSYIVSDPKGSLYGKYKDYLEAKGYVVKKLDFTDPYNSAHYNFLNYIREPKDITKAAYMIASQEKSVVDPFWDQSATLLLSALIAYCIEALPKKDQNFAKIEELIHMAKMDEYSSSSTTKLDEEMNKWRSKHPESWAIRQYDSFRVSPARTLNSILITVSAKMRALSSIEVKHMMSSDDINISSIGDRKTAIFVVVSDTDRSMDTLANLFFTQAMNELCWHADHDCPNFCLKVPVRFILDDFATNCRIGEFPRMIASIRSRGISTMLMIQAESQLNHSYGDDGRTIIGNCDTYIYLGGTDVATAKEISFRCNAPLNKILNMPVGANIVFRRGENPKVGINVKLEEFEKQLKFRAVDSKVERYEDKRTLQERLSGPVRTQEAYEKQQHEKELAEVMDMKNRWLFL